MRFGRGVLLALVVSCLCMPSIARGDSQIVSLSPSEGSIEGGTRVRITFKGSVLTGIGNIEVRFGTRAATSAKKVDRSTLEVVAPPGPPGPVQVRIINEFWGTATAPVVFTYIGSGPQPIRVEPAQLLVGSEPAQIRIHGRGFTSGTRVWVQDTAIPTTVVDQRQLQVTLPAELLARAGSLELRVTDPLLGTKSGAALILPVENPKPEITALDSASPEGQWGLITVRGQGFRPDSTILIGDAPVRTAYRSAELLVATPPGNLIEGSKRLPITVRTPEPGGGSSNTGWLVIENPPTPGRFVVFTSNREGGRNHLYLLDRKLKKLDPLAEANSELGNDAYPSISADGRFIAFQSDRTRKESHIYLFDRETRKLDLLPEANHPSAFDGFPSISPDGRFIVFESDRTGRPKVFLFDLQHRTLSPLTEADEASADDGLPAISN
jgi:hypothetical protein